MKLSIGSSFLEIIPDFDARFAKLKALGFDAVDFNLSLTDAPCYRDVAQMETLCAEVRAAAEKHGLEIFQVHGPWPTDDKTPESRAVVWDYMRRAIYGCHLLGSRYLIIHPQMPYGTIKTVEDPEVAKAITVDMLRFLLPDCEKYGVVLCLENMPFRRQRISTTDRIVEVVREINSPYLQICFDTGHCHVMYEDIGESVRLAGPYIKTLHIHDNWYDDEHSLPFTCAIDWPAFAKALIEIGYDGTLNLEVRKVFPKMSPGLQEAYIRMTVESAKQLRQLIEDTKK